MLQGKRPPSSPRGEPRGTEQLLSRPALSPLSSLDQTWSGSVDRALQYLPHCVWAWPLLDGTLGRAGVPFTCQGYLQHRQPVQCEPRPWGAAVLLQRGLGPGAPHPAPALTGWSPAASHFPEPARDGITAPGPHLRRAAVPPGSARIGPTQRGSLLCAQGQPGPAVPHGEGQGTTG